MGRVGVGVGGVDTHEVDLSVFRRQTKIVCSQMRMTNVTLAVVVAFLAVLACGGGSVRASLDAPSPDGPTIVGEGQDCQETVSPEFQTICAPGLDCVPVNPGLAGSPGKCQPETAQSPSGPTFVGEDEDCNGTVSPEFQTLCGPGLTCVVDPDAGFGASGTCKPAQPTVVGEGDECNGSLPPEFATICAEGLTCVTSGVPGASGTCQAEASFGIPFDCRVDFSQRASRSSQYSTRSSSLTRTTLSTSTIRRAI